MVSAVVAAQALGGGGCRPKRPPGAAVSASPVVARVAGSPIHAAEVADQMRRQRRDAPGALDELVTFEVLAQAAGADGAPAPSADEQEVLRNLKVQRLIEREIEPLLAPAAIDEADVRTVYERAKGRFVHGRLVQVAVLCVFTGARMKPEPRARAEGTARSLKAAVMSRAAAGGTDASPAALFESIAKDPVWADRKVSATTVWQEQDRPFPLVVGRAVQALTRPGETTDLVGDETGYYIARYISERPPENVSLAEAAPGIRREMYEPWRRQRFLQLSLAMSQGHDIEVFPENFPALASQTDRAAH